MREGEVAPISQEQLSLLCVIVGLNLHLMVPPGAFENKRKVTFFYVHCILS